MSEDLLAGETLIHVGPTEDLAVGEARKICSHATGPIALFRADDGFYALSDTCSHGKASLSEGWFEGFEIECPVHSGRFDVRSGAPLSFPATEPVARYETRMVDGELYVVVATSA
jgi:nitrite reductase/ring-hydroxylating ferredoxin subunit